MSASDTASRTYVYIAGDSRRSKIFVKSPQQLLASLLHEFCENHGLNPDEYALQKGKKMLDLSLPWRLSGLTARTELEIVKRTSRATSTTSKVNIALMLPEGQRIVNSFTLDTSLWRLLLQSEISSGVNLTGQFAANGDYMQPVVTYLNTTYRTLKQLEETKLSKMGVRKGQNCMLRLRFEPQSDFSKNDPNFMSFLDAQRQQMQVPPYAGGPTSSTLTDVPSDAFVDVQSPTSTSATSSSLQRDGDDENMLKMDDDDDDDINDGSGSGTGSGNDDKMAGKNVDDASAEDENMLKMDDGDDDDDEQNITATDRANEKIAKGSSSSHAQPADQTSTDQTANTDASIPLEDPKNLSPVKVFMIDPSSATQFSAHDFDTDLTEEDFRLSAAELRRMLKEADEKRKKSELFISKKVREKEREQLAAIYDKCVVRFRFSNGPILQATFRPSHTVRHLQKFVQDLLADTPCGEKQMFAITVAPPVQRIDTEQNLYKTLKEMNFLPAVILNVGIDRKYHEQRAKAAQKRGEAYVTPSGLVLKDEIVNQAQVVSGMNSIREQTAMPRNLNTNNAQSKSKDGLSASGGGDDDDDEHRQQDEGRGKKSKIPKWMKLGRK